MQPKKFGDRVDMNHTGQIDTNAEMTDNELERLARAIALELQGSKGE